MLNIEVELLAGRYAATAHDDRSRAEWPPHPARFFSALVAAHYEAAEPAPGEREALLWLERQPPPSLRVSFDEDDPELGRRRVLPVFVPVNDVTTVGDIDAGRREAQSELDELRSSGADAKALKGAEKKLSKEEKALEAVLAKLQEIPAKVSASEVDTARTLLPERRIRQGRTLPVVFPAEPIFHFLWPEAPPLAIREHLVALLGRVTRVGHSSSLVSCRLGSTDVHPNLVPDAAGAHVLRVVADGQLERLDRAWERHQGVESRVLPAVPQRYGPPRTSGVRPVAASVFSTDWIVFERVGGARPLSSRAGDYTRALRAALLEQHGTAPLSPVLSGHGKGGEPAGTPHLAFVALPFVGHAHADGSIQGFALVLPRSIQGSERRDLLLAVASWMRERKVDEEGTLELALRDAPPVRIRHVEYSEKVSLRASSWCRRSRRFITALPIALDRNPGNLRSNQQGTANRATIQAQRTIAEACERIGLPRPASVELSFAPLLSGAQHVRTFRPWPTKADAPRRVRVHAELTFPEPVEGPVLLGAGRYFGLGLCLPLGEVSR